MRRAAGQLREERAARQEAQQTLETTNHQLDETKAALADTQAQLTASRVEQAGAAAVAAASAIAFDNSDIGALARKLRVAVRENASTKSELDSANTTNNDLHEHMKAFVKSAKEHAETKLQTSTARAAFYENLANTLQYPSSDNDQVEDEDKDETYDDEEETKPHRNKQPRQEPSPGYRDGNSFSKEMRYTIVALMSTGETSAQGNRTWEMMQQLLAPLLGASAEVAAALPVPSTTSMKKGRAALSLVARVYSAGVVHLSDRVSVANDGTSDEGVQFGTGIMRTDGVEGVQMPGGIYEVADKSGEEGQQQFKERTEFGFQAFADMHADLHKQGINIACLFEDLLDKRSLQLVAEQFEFTTLDEAEWVPKFIADRLADPLTNGRWMLKIKRTQQDHAANENTRDKLLLEDIKQASATHVPGWANLTEEEKDATVDFVSGRCDDHAFKLETDDGIIAVGNLIGVNLKQVVYEVCKFLGRTKRGMYHYSKQKQMEQLMGRFVKLLPSVGTRIMMHQNALLLLELRDDLMQPLFDELEVEKVGKLGASVYANLNNQRVLDALFVLGVLWWHILGVVRMFINKKNDGNDPRVQALTAREYVTMQQEKMKSMTALKANGALLLDRSWRGNNTFSNVNVKQAQINYHNDPKNRAAKDKLTAVETALQTDPNRRQDVISMIEKYAAAFEVKGLKHTSKYMRGGPLAPQTIDDARAKADDATKKASDAQSKATTPKATRTANGLSKRAQELTKVADRLEDALERIFDDMDNGLVDTTVTTT